MLTGLISIPIDGAADWITPNWPVPAVMAASRRTAARLTPGAICLSSSSHFALKLLLQPLLKRCDPCLLVLASDRRHEHADPPHSIGLLRARHQRPNSRAA